MDNNKFNDLKFVGTVSLAVVMALSGTSCATLKEMTRTITPNAYSE